MDHRSPESLMIEYLESYEGDIAPELYEGLVKLAHDIFVEGYSDGYDDGKDSVEV